MNTIKAILLLSESRRLTRYVERHAFPNYYDAINHWRWQLNSFFIKSLEV